MIDPSLVHERGPGPASERQEISLREAQGPRLRAHDQSPASFDDAASM